MSGVMRRELQFSCNFCPDVLTGLKAYLVHLRCHRHLSTVYPCGINYCRKVYDSEVSLRSHIIRHHNIHVSTYKKQENRFPFNDNARIVCTVPSCTLEMDSLKDLMRHLKSQIAGGASVKCPFSPCRKVYELFTSLKSHVSREHSLAARPIIPHDVSNITDDDPVTDFSFDYQQPGDVTEPPSLSTFTAWLRSQAEFYMSLEFKYLIPRSTTQKFFEEMEHIYNQAIHSIFEKSGRHSSALEMQESFERNVSLFREGFLQLRSSYRRTGFFTKNYLYVQPKKFPANGKPSFYYIPIADTLKKMMSSKVLNIDLEAPTCSNTDTLSDFYDGLLYKQNIIFKENLKSFSIIMFQDAFEICCPIGSAKKKYKLIGVYLTLGNMLSHVRTHVNSIQLVALCFEKNYNHDGLYAPIVNELKQIEEQGIEIEGHGTIKGSLMFVCGDNLGSHSLGGFVENFSRSRYFCRYCIADRPSFYAVNGHLTFIPARSIQNYDEALLGENVLQQKGVKFNSKFNDLNSFHVCNPGLPPCLGHDLLEGVVAHDLVLIIRDLVSKNWFTYNALQELMASFQYSTLDQRDKPVLLKETHSKVNGGMWQVYNFLRVLPLVINECIEDEGDPSWKLVVLISEIIDIVCAPIIHKSFLGHLQSLIVEYLSLRVSTFPDTNLRPKHHYLIHYPELILQFGPLGKVWTLRFESKHSFFKNCIRSSKNFKNVPLSCCRRHELLQACLRAGGSARCEVKVGNSRLFEPSIYCKDIQSAVEVIRDLSSIRECLKAEVKGILYRKGSILPLGQMMYEYEVVFGRVSLILINKDDRIFFLVEVVGSTFLPYLRMHKLGQFQYFDCVPFDELPSRSPANCYKRRGLLYAKLRHSLVSRKLS